MPAAILDRANWPCTDTSPPATTGQGSPATTAAAAARLQQWLRAYGSGDAATYCEIGGPLFETVGLPRDECLEMFLTFRTEPAGELASMAEATVDARQAKEVAPGTVEIPEAALAFPTPISEPARPDGIYVMTTTGPTGTSPTPRTSEAIARPIGSNTHRGGHDAHQPQDSHCREPGHTATALEGLLEVLNPYTVNVSVSSGPLGIGAESVPLDDADVVELLDEDEYLGWFVPWMRGRYFARTPSSSDASRHRSWT